MNVMKIANDIRNVANVQLAKVYVNHLASDGLIHICYLTDRKQIPAETGLLHCVLKIEHSFKITSFHCFEYL